MAGVSIGFYGTWPSSDPASPHSLGRNVRGLVSKL